MFYRVFFFLLGFGLMVLGFIFLIMYMNIMPFGYNFLDYVNFIIRRIECYYVVIGLIIIILTTTIPGGKKYELYI